MNNMTMTTQTYALKLEAEPSNGGYTGAQSHMCARFNVTKTELGVGGAAIKEYPQFTAVDAYIRTPENGHYPKCCIINLTHGSYEDGIDFFKRQAGEPHQIPTDLIQGILHAMSETIVTVFFVVDVEQNGIIRAVLAEMGAQMTTQKISVLTNVHKGFVDEISQWWDSALFLTAPVK